MAETVRKAEQQVKESLLVLWADLEPWQRDNHYITTGYRKASNSFRKSVQSLGYLHNESVNIYTHLIGAFAFAGLGFAALRIFVPQYYALANWEDTLAFACFFAAAATCLGMSASFHTISNHSHNVASFGNKLDYIGIVFLIAGSMAPSLYYGLEGYPHLQKFYWTMLSALSIACITVSISPSFRSPEYRPIRASMFVALGLSAVFPVIHGLMIFPEGEFSRRIGLFWVILEAFLYIGGAGLYAMRFPERTSPGTFDLFGSSHQIFHCLVLAAAASHLKGMVVAFDYSHGLRVAP